VKNTLRGTEVHGAILNEIEVREIRELSKTIMGTKIARLYGVGKTAIYDIIHRRSWKHLN
jgi:hypothetical protein